MLSPRDSRLPTPTPIMGTWKSDRARWLPRERVHSQLHSRVRVPLEPPQTPLLFCFHVLVCTHEPGSVLPFNKAPEASMTFASSTSWNNVTRRMGLCLRPMGGVPASSCCLLHPLPTCGKGGQAALRDISSPAPPTTFSPRDITWHRQVAAQSLSGRLTKGRD